MKYIILFIFFVVCLSDKKPPLNIQQKVKFGNFKITYLNDEGAFMKPKELYSTSETKFWNEHKNLLNENGNLFIGFGGFLIEIGNQKIIVDTGVGPDETHVKGIGFVSGGPFMKNLEKAGVKPDQITDVFLSHLHKDNVGWATTKKNGKYELTFPKATYWCNEYEWQSFEKYLQSEKNEVDKDLIARFYEPVKGIIKFISEIKPLAPGLFPIVCAGHSPGLTVLKLEDKNKRLWILPDLFHTPAEFHDILLLPDLDQTKFAKESRFIILPEFTRSLAVVAIPRFAPYVFGKISEENRELVWDPCTTEECKFYPDEKHLAFQVEDL